MGKWAGINKGIEIVAITCHVMSCHVMLGRWFVAYSLGAEFLVVVE